MRTVIMMPENEPMFRMLLETIQATKNQPHTLGEMLARDVALVVVLEYINSITFPELTGFDEIEEWVEWWLEKYEQVYCPIIILPDQSL